LKAFQCGAPGPFICFAISGRSSLLFSISKKQNTYLFISKKSAGRNNRKRHILLAKFLLKIVKQFAKLSLRKKISSFIKYKEQFIENGMKVLNITREEVAEMLHMRSMRFSMNELKDSSDNI
jgi:hypothetical protein